MNGSRQLLGLLGGGPSTESLAASAGGDERTRRHDTTPPELQRIPYAAGSTAADVQVEADAEPPIAVREIVAAIDLVARGLAVRVSLIGFDLTSDLVREAAEVARGWGCRSIATIDAGGRLGLMIAGGQVEGG